MQDGSAIVEKFPYTETGPLANLLLCQGTPRLPVLEIKAKKRLGDENFVTCMRKTLGRHYGETPVGLGGVFVINKGKAKLHVMVSDTVILIFIASLYTLYSFSHWPNRMPNFLS